MVSLNKVLLNPWGGYVRRGLVDQSTTGKSSNSDIGQMKFIKKYGQLHPLLAASPWRAPKVWRVECETKGGGIGKSRSFESQAAPAALGEELETKRHKYI